MAKITARHLQKLQKCWEAAGGAKASKPSKAPAPAPRRDIAGEKHAIDLAVALPSVGQPGHLKKYAQLIKFVEKLPWASQDAVEKKAERMGLAKKKGIDAEVQRHVAAAPGLLTLQARRTRGIKTPTQAQG